MHLSSRTGGCPTGEARIKPEEAGRGGNRMLGIGRPLLTTI